MKLQISPNDFKKGLYRFELVIERDGNRETITLYKIINSRFEADSYMKGIRDLADIQGLNWKRVEWSLDERN